MFPSTTDFHGIFWEGPFATTHSFALVNRALCSRLIQHGHHLSLHPAGLAESEGSTLADVPDLREHVRKALSGDILHISHRWPPRLKPPQARAWVVIQPWEFGSIPTAWLAPFRDYAEEIWVPSRFVRDCYLQSGLSAEHVHVIPNGVDAQCFQPGLEPFPLRTRVDTAAAHLAGALGVPVWLAVARIADWRWLRDRDDSPWYPSMRLFRQEKLGDWCTFFERMAEELRPLVATRRQSPGRVHVEIVPGELIDRLTILEIKNERLTDPAKRTAVAKELAVVRQARDRAIPRSVDLSRLTAALRAVNEGLWDSEDRLRLFEQARDFGSEFIEQARSVYRQNDRRAALKQQINTLLGAGPGEPKAYADYWLEENGEALGQDHHPAGQQEAVEIAEFQIA